MSTSLSSDMSRKKHFKDGIIDFSAGSLGGIALVYVGQPLDTIKVKMQTFPTVNPSMMQCFMNTLKNDGVYRGLYAGTGPALVTNIVENSVLFLCYGFCQKIIQKVTDAKSVDELGTLSNATAGFLASFFSSIAICPTELIKCKLQALRETKQAMQTDLISNKIEIMGPMKLTSHIIRTEGAVGLFTGLVPTLAREMPGYFFFFGGYEGTRELFRKQGQSKDEIGLLKTMTAGAVGGCIFWSSTYPIDVAKSRIQVSGSKENMIKVILNIFRKEGLGALYNGLTPTLVRTVPATATLFVTYEYSKKWLTYAFTDF